MTVLSDIDRQAIADQFMRDESRARRQISGLKVDQRSAVNSIDDWWNVREVGFLSSFPSATNTYSDEQKIILLIEVLKRR